MVAFYANILAGFYTDIDTSGSFLKNTPSPEDQKSIGVVAFGRDHEAEIDIRRKTKVDNLEDRFMEDFGIKVQIAGSDDSYLCDNDLTLAAALVEDERKLGRKATRTAAIEV